MRTPKNATTIAQVAHEVSSKNAGNFLLTFDIVFGDWRTYAHVRDGGYLTPSKVAALYNLRESDIVRFVAFDAARAFKITIRRPLASGDFGESDVFGAQQYAPLLSLRIGRLPRQQSRKRPSAMQQLGA